jgi:outer membrane protein assembly factor BamA
MVGPMTRTAIAAPALAAVLTALSPHAGAQTVPTGWEVIGLPALNYNPDDKLGYGVALQLFNYGAAGKLPYVLTLQPTVYLSTGGRRDYTLFFDAPDVGGSGWRVDAYFGHESQNASYYGLGNASVRDEALEEEPNEKYYRFGRERVQLTANLQRRLGASRFRVLAGMGASRGRVDETADGAPSTFLAEELAGQNPPEGWSNYVRAGVVWDSRDREVHTSRGVWADVLVQRADKAFGSDWSFTRSTLTVRGYVPLTASLTLAERGIVQNVSGDAPFYELAVVQTSYKPQEGLGGSHTLRGFSRSRFLGKGLAVLNSELRWRAKSLTVLGAPSTVTLTAFVDAGRVWTGEVDLSEAASDLHFGYGGGVRLGRGPNFVVAIDVGHSKESTAPIYIGLGFLF